MDNKVNLTIAGVSLVKHKRDKKSGVALIRLAKEFRELLSENGYFDNCPFDSISLIFRYGETENLEPDGFKINKKRGQLDVAAYVNIFNLLELTDKEVESYFRLALIEILCDIAANYDLPYEFLDVHREYV